MYLATKCENCGRESHCGIPLKEQHRDGDNRLIEIEVCKQCRCYQCTTDID